MKWHQSYQGFDAKFDEQPVQEYEKYYASVKRKLPKRFVEFDESHSLHDADLRSLAYDVLKKQIKMAWITSVPEGAWLVPRAVTLIYSGVSNLSISGPTTGILRGSEDYKFLLFNEIEWREDETFEHRLLFHSGIELSLVFKGFHFRLDD